MPNAPRDEAKRQWSAPMLIRHESLTMLTQGIGGSHTIALLQAFSCEVTPSGPVCK